MAYGVNERTREIGVRVALGANAGDVVRLVVRGALGMTSIGVGLGLLGGVAAARVCSGTLLFGVDSTDVADVHRRLDRDLRRGRARELDSGTARVAGRSCASAAGFVRRAEA